MYVANFQYDIKTEIARCRRTSQPRGRFGRLLQQQQQQRRRSRPNRLDTRSAFLFIYFFLSFFFFFIYFPVTLKYNVPPRSLAAARRRSRTGPTRPIRQNTPATTYPSHGRDDNAIITRLCTQEKTGRLAVKQSGGYFTISILHFEIVKTNNRRRVCVLNLRACVF